MSAIRKLIEAFAEQIELPIEPRDVQAWVTRSGYCDRFNIYYVDCDPEAFDGIYVERQGGEFIEHDAPYGEPMRVREIFVNGRLPLEQRRVAEVKETLHILDAIGQATNTPEGVSTMIRYSATRVKLGSDFGAITDVMAMPQALAVLLPKAALDLIRPAFEAGKLTIDEIADIAKLPAAYVELVLSDAWAGAYVAMLDLSDALNGDNGAA